MAHGGRPIPVDWHISMRLLQYPTNTSHKYLWRKGLAQDDALNSMVEESLSIDAEYILSIDDDTQPPPAVILDLLRVLEQSDTSIMACGGIYTTKTNPPEPIVYMEPGAGAFWRWKLGDIFPCWAVGNGCLMVRSEIFRMMSKPWYKWIRTPAELANYPDVFPHIVDAPLPTTVEISPDVFFFTKLAQMGFKVLAHGGVLPIHHDVTTGKRYWLPKGSHPCQNVIVNGQPYDNFAWTAE